MKIEIKDKYVAEAEINIKKFKELLSEHWDLEKAVKESSSILFIEEQVNENSFKDFIYNTLNWQEIIDKFKHMKDDSMKVRMYKVKYDNWIKYKPGSIENNNRNFELEEIKESGESLILIQSFIKQPSFTIKNFIDTHQFTYGLDNNWKLIYKVTE